MPYAKLLLTILLIVIAVVVATSFSTFYSAIRPAKFVSSATPADFGLGYESVTLTTSDDVELDAWFIPARKETNKTIVVLHGYPFDKGNILPHALFLQETFNLLLFDFRYFGKSKGSYTSVGFHEQKDLRAAVKYLRGKNQTKLGAYGFSLGGTVAIMEAEHSKLNAVVAESSYATLDDMLGESYRQFGVFKPIFTTTTKMLSRLILNINVADVSPERSIRQLRIPVLIVHGSSDEQIPVGNAYRLKKVSPEAELWVVEGAGHGMAGDVAGKEYARRVTEFFEENIS